eukprot:1827274-Rhodomonas_salina.1
MALRGRGLYDRQIVSMGCGWNHVIAAAVDPTGRDVVIGWGLNGHGQLGLGHVDDVVEPTVITSLCGVGVKQKEMTVKRHKTKQRRGPQMRTVEDGD